MEREVHSLLSKHGERSVLSLFSPKSNDWCIRWGMEASTMNIVRKTWFIPLLFAGIILVVGIIYIGSLLSKEEQISSDEIQTQLEVMYEGTVDSLVMENGVYIAEMTRAGAVYAAEVDAVTGSVLSMNQLSEMVVEPESEPEPEPPEVLSEEEIRKVIAKEYEDEIERISLNKKSDAPFYEVEAVKNQVLVKVKVDAITGGIISAEPQEATSNNALISREQAIEIALGQLNGEVEDVEFEQTDDGGFYLIEIEQDNDEGDDVEAVIQIHAITGEVITVDWDD